MPDLTNYNVPRNKTSSFVADEVFAFLEELDSLLAPILSTHYFTSKCRRHECHSELREGKTVPGSVRATAFLYSTDLYPLRKPWAGRKNLFLFDGLYAPHAFSAIISFRMSLLLSSPTQVGMFHSRQSRCLKHVGRGGIGCVAASHTMLAAAATVAAAAAAEYPKLEPLRIQINLHDNCS